MLNSVTTVNFLCFCVSFAVENLCNAINITLGIANGSFRVLCREQIFVVIISLVFCCQSIPFSSRMMPNEGVKDML